MSSPASASAPPDVLVLCGHGDYGPDANERVREAARHARELGEYADYLIYGNRAELKHRRKHNLLIGPAPAFAWTFVNVLESAAQRAVFLGNADSQIIFDACLDFFADRLAAGGKSFQFVPERAAGFAANVIAGRRALYGDSPSGGPALLLNGDLPLLFHLDAPLRDPDLPESDMIFDANSRELQGAFLPREYRVQMSYAPPGGAARIFHVKEPNYFLLDLDLLTEELMDKIYGSRRIHDEHDGGWKKLVLDTFVRRGRILETLHILFSRRPLHNLFAWFAGAYDRLTFDARQAEALASYGLRKISGRRVRCRVRVSNEDPGALKDLDSFNDWSYLNAMYQLATEDGARPEAFAEIHPHAELVRAFAEAKMPELAQRISIFADFPAYMNAEFAEFELQPPFDSRGRFRPTMSAEQIIADDLAYHRAFVQRIPAKRNDIEKN